MNYIILNYQINKRVTRVVSCYPITNWVVFEFVIFNLFIIRVMFGLVNTIENLLLRTTRHELPPLVIHLLRTFFFLHLIQSIHQQACLCVCLYGCLHIIGVGMQAKALESGFES